MFEGPALEALWSFMCVPDIVHMRVTAREFNDTMKCGTYGELVVDASRHSGTCSTGLVQPDAQ